MTQRRKALSDMRTAIRDNLDEATASFWSNAQLLRMINRAKDYVWLEAKKLKGQDYFQISRTSLDGTVTILGESYACTDFEIVAGTRTYTLPPDFTGDLHLIECITSGQEFLKFAT